MFKNVNGCGTIFYGATEAQEDKSFVTTKWFILLGFPILPLGSLRVVYHGETDTESGGDTTTIAQYTIIGKAAFALRQVLRTYFLFFSLFGFGVGMVALAWYLDLQGWLGVMSMIISVILMIIFGFALGPEYFYKAKLHERRRLAEDYERFLSPIGIAVLVIVPVLYMQNRPDPADVAKGKDLLVSEPEVDLYNFWVERYNSLSFDIQKAANPEERLAAFRQFVDFSSKEIPFDSDTIPVAEERQKKEANRFLFKSVRLEALYYLGLNSPDSKERAVSRGNAIQLYQAILDEFSQLADSEDPDLREGYLDLQRSHAEVVRELADFK